MIEPELLEKYQYTSRLQKAHKIERVLLDSLGPGADVGTLRCLDVGCSIGVISTDLARTFGEVVGVEPLAEAINVAHRLHPDSGAAFIQGDGLRLPFPDEAFDVVVCAQVYEHSARPHQLVREIWRTLRPGGSCFFSGPNRLWPVEYHYNWCCLHWLPRSLLHRYCQRRYGHPFDLVLYTYWQLHALWRDFECRDYTVRLVYEPERFLDNPEQYRWARLVPRSLAALLISLLANYNWVLVKPAVSVDA
jgi:ubiquinone/menaquinone biosynthesis C-methylase UbiE